ncbi:CHASE domain-containing protein [Herbaspirillum sp. GCM10030257]|uniref:CHASE domain-containing protein n=1 Tax=Herbaspirillum sp. GCM10030257 TaxID=3273393 RepID=UPI003616B7CF
MNYLERRPQQIRQLFKAREMLTAAVLVLSLFITYRLWDVAARSADQALQTTFEFKVREANIRIEQRLAIYQQMLRATVGLFNSADDVTRKEFQSFISSLSLPEMFPGVQGIGLSLIVPAAEKDRHIAAVRAEGFPEYTITPEGTRDIYTSIIYLEPFFGRNLRAFGYDMYSEPARRAAMDFARDAGSAALSAKVKLVQEGGSAIQNGFLMYLPLFRNGAPHTSLEQRRANIIGWVYAPFRVDDFMHGVSGEYADELDIEIYDDETINAESKMFDSNDALDAASNERLLKRVSFIQAANRTWTVVTAASPQFEMSLRSDRPQLIMQSGISISLMIALLVWLFLDDRARALHAAEQAMQLALYDALTGLPNRKLLEERLGQALSKAKRGHSHVALLFIDLDKFKPVNDNFGHAYGDLLLKEVAKRLQNCMRESDTASRLGGDEFVVLLSDIEGRNGTALVAKKILDLLVLPYEISGHTFEISASIGAAVYPEDGADGKSLIKNADLAMYEAKNAGRATIRFAERGTQHNSAIMQAANQP